MNDSEKKYKILIVNGQSINATNATGITLITLLSKVPPENIQEICLANANISNTKFLSHCIPQYSNPIRYLFKKLAGGHYITSMINKTIQQDKLKNKNNSISIKNKIKEIVRSYMDVCPLFIKKETLAFAKQFNPDIIYTLGSSIMVLKISLIISNFCNCPILLHFMDNWRESMYRGFCMKYPRYILNNLVKKIEDQSVAGLAISNFMAVCYSKYNIKYYPLMNAIDISNIRTPKTNTFKISKVIYTGGLHLNRYLSLLDIQKSISLLNRNGYKCKLFIYTSSKDMYLKELFDENFVEFMEYVPHDKIYDVYDIADILVHIESFDEDQILFTKYSISTKISEYLSSGKPIICYAPRQIAVSKYIEEVQAGFSDTSIDSLYKHLLLLLENPMLRIQFGRNGIQAARNNHTIDIAKKILYKAIKDNIQSYKIRKKNDKFMLRN